MEGKFLDVIDTLNYHEFEQFTKPWGPYIPSKVQKFYTTYGELVPKSNKKESGFRRESLSKAESKMQQWIY